MKLLIHLRKISDKSFDKKYEFTVFPVNIGRESDNDIILEDHHKIISRSHSKIDENSGVLKILDLGSINFTYLNGTKLLSGYDSDLKTGDLVKIGDYEMEVTIEKLKSEPVFDDQKTMIFFSPFDEIVTKLKEDMSKLSEKYSTDDSPLKSEMLRFSINQRFDDLETSDVNKILSEYFLNKFLGQDITNSKIKDISIINEPSIAVPKTKSELNNVPKSSFTKAKTDYSFSNYFSESVDVLLDTVIKLIQGFLQFKQEFFGVTIYQIIPTGSLKEIKDYLFNEEISLEDQKKRINLIKEETRKILNHQIGLLEGYKISVTEGSLSLLQSLDPDIIEKEIFSKQTSGFEKLFPFLKKSHVLQTIKQNYKKSVSDPFHIEKKFFRPSFIKGYQKRISSKGEENEY